MKKLLLRLLRLKKRDYELELNEYGIMWLSIYELFV